MSESAHTPEPNEPRYRNREALEDAYREADGVIAEAAEDFEVGYYTVRRWLVEYDIHEPEKPSETSPRNVEQLNPEDLGLSPIRETGGSA